MLQTTESGRAERQAFEPCESREPSDSEMDLATRQALSKLTRIDGARSIFHQDGRTLVAEAMGEALSASRLRDLTALIHSGFLAPGGHDYCEIGRVLVCDVVESYLRRSEGFYENRDAYLAEILAPKPVEDDDD